MELEFAAEPEEARVFSSDLCSGWGYKFSELHNYPVDMTEKLPCLVLLDLSE